MTKEEKQLLLIDLCARLPYGVLVFIRKPFGCVMSEKEEEELTTDTLQEFIENDDVRVLPYLRPMSSMTDDEKKTLNNILEYQYYSDDSCMCEAGDYLNAHHFDYRGLIPKGLALEAEEGMYETE